MVKIYYMPHSHELVNVERIADTALPPDALKSPQVVREFITKAFHSHHPKQAPEDRAHLATMGNAMKAATANVAAPPDTSRDLRPDRGMDERRPADGPPG